MSKSRLEAFSDGVIAILITIMVLELRAPHAADLGALRAIVPSLLFYVLSFILVGIYWTNHHHLLHATSRVNGAILWANLHLLFWLSLIPFTTSWLGENHGAPLPTATYGVVLLAAAIAYTILARRIIALEGEHSLLATAVGRDRKGYISLALYASAIPLAFLRPWIADTLYATVAVIWLVPDRRIERVVSRD
jgi:TMEM175 potassium channel family protein